MEYFDFEEASNAIKKMPDDDDVASDCQEVDETDAVENYESLFFDKNFQLHAGVGLAAEAGEDGNEDLQNQDSIPNPAESTVAGERNAGSQYPMFLSPQPCDFCRQMGFDCFIIQRGVLNNGCTCCVSLYRECSFTHTKAPGKYLHTLHPVGEDDVTSTGGPTGIRTLKSVGSSKFDHLESRGRKSGARFSRDAVRILKNWLADHNQNPYPNEEEKDALKQRTGLKRNQIANWLANARRRGKVLPPTRSTSPTPGAVDIPGSSNTPSASSTVSTSSSSTVEYALMTPLERWKHSPPEHEAAATSDIIRAMANASLPPPPPPPSNVQNQSQQQSQAAPPTVSGHGRSMSRKTGSSNDSNSLFRAPSVSSYETENKSATSDYSFASAFSHRSSQHSFNSTDRKDRRRRRKHMPPVPAFDRPVRGARIFQCTFCTDTFPAKYDWQRHEKSVHLALEKWTCALQGGVITTPEGQKICSFCRSSNPSEDHLETHNYQACQEKTMQERTFYRKDHLNQHLRLMHNVKYDSSMDQWRSTTNEIKSRCGLCDANFATWKDRVDHIAQHFKNGVDMSQWKGDWGLEPYVQRLVENCIPPYLIANERESLNPRRASGSNNSSSQKTPASIATSSVKLLDPTDETSFARLENELKAYIACQLLDGNFPSDKQIQDQGRIIVYGSAEVWYKTCADNAIWLSMLKRDCGMEDLPGLENITLEELGLQPPFAGCLQRPPLETNHLAAKNVRHSWFSNASLGSAALSITGMQSPALISSSGFHSAAASIPGSLAGSCSGSIAMSSAAPSSGMPGLSSGWSSNFSVGEKSTSDWTGLLAFENNPAHTSFELEVLQQLNDPESRSMDIDSSLFGLGGLNIPDGTASQFKSDDFSKNVNVPQFDHGMTTTMSTSETQTAPVPISTTHSNNEGMLSQFDSFFSSQPEFQ